MTVLGPGFSERVFEFAFNAEYANRMQAVLAGAPSIPTQKEEKWLGYDVMFEVKRRGGSVHALALQHKVARYVDQLAATNQHFWHSVGGPYYAFRLDTDQYNLIEALASAKVPGVELYYCAPIFATRSDMDTHYLGNSVEANSVWIDVAGAGQIPDNDQHSIVYSANGSNAVRHSGDPVRLAVKGPGARRTRLHEVHGRDVVDFHKLYRTAFETVREYWPRRRSRNVDSPKGESTFPSKPPDEESPSLVSTARLLSTYFGLSLLLEVRK